MSESLKQSLGALCSGLAALWRESSFPTGYRSPFETLYEVITRADDNAALMPISGRAIRGSTGVEISRTEKRPSKERATEDLITDSYGQEQSFHPEGLNQRLRETRDAVAAFGRAVDADVLLGYRLRQSLGYKTWSASQFADLDRAGWNLELGCLFALRKRLARSLVAHGFDPASRDQFEGWSAVEEEIIQHLQDLRTLDRYEYEILIFLNGPPADFEGEASLVDLAQGEETISVGVCYASDQLVSHLVEYEHQKVPGYEKINTVLRYRISLPVEVGEKPYLQAYPNASEVGGLLLDGLRLLRPGDDIGILALEIVAVDDYAPTIRKTWADRFQTELARFYPRRFDFRSPQSSVLQEEEVTNLRTLVSLLVGKSGRSRSILQARKRLANSIDRYAPDDPEKLIEYAIALESLFLDDSDGRTELSYRLALRAARLLEKDLESRRSCFHTIRDLYKFRSRIAHGGSLEELKPIEQKRLESVLLRCPSIVSRSIRALLERGPSAVGKKPADYWQELELG